MTIDSNREKRREEIRAKYQRLREEYGKLYDNLLEILFRYDPIGINFGDNQDEYEPEVGTILPKLKDASSIEDVQRILHQEFIRWFDEVIAGPKEKYAKIAEDVWDSYQNSSWKKT